jgi:hypothetical protein
MTVVPYKFPAASKIRPAYWIVPVPTGERMQHRFGPRALSHLLGEHNRSTVVWDYIAVYAPGMLWQDAPPKPIYSDNPVRDVIGGAKESIQRLLASGVNSAGGEE